MESTRMWLYCFAWTVWALPIILVRSVAMQLLRWITHTPTVRLPRERAQFRQEIENIMPITSSLVRAQTILKRNDFSLLEVEENGRQVLRAQHSRAILLPYMVRVWWVRLEHAERRITSVDAASYINAV
jgi:hypothetical protein